MTNRLQICQKRRYATAAEADAMIRFLVKDGRADKNELKRYDCRTCHNWHLTSQKTYRRPRRRK